MATPKFRPYRGIESKIKSLPIQPGYVYFSTDTGRIFLDYDNKRLTMGGNGASLYYADDTDVSKDLLDNYYIDIDTILDADSSLKANDLIINSDGAFYRVMEVNSSEYNVKCVRIAVSGSGSGGGSGDSGGGSGDSSKKIQLELIGSFPDTFIYGKEVNITFKATSRYDTKLRYNVTIEGPGKQTKTLNYIADSGVEYTFEIGSQLFQGNNTIVVVAHGDNSEDSKLTYPYRECIIFALNKSSEFNPRKVCVGELNFSCIPVGSTNKTLDIYVDNILAKSVELTKTQTNTNYSTYIPAQTHGTHNIKAILKANVGGADIETDPISYQIAWRDTSLENQTPLIWFPEGYQETITQYEDYIVEYMVWDPDSTTDIETRFYKNMVELASSPRYLTYDTVAAKKWNITDYEVGTNHYLIQVGATSASINFEVNKDTERDLDIILGGLVLNLDSSGRSNEENLSSRITWISKDTPEATAVKFNNFNWYNNGWIEDEDERSCLRISNGASISIPITALNILNSKQLEDSLTFEFRFKVRNIQEYATLIDTYSTEDDQGNVSIEKVTHTEKGVLGRLFGNNIGLCIGTQEAFIKSANTIVNARYKEDEIINLTLEAESKNGMALLYIYIQGILSGIAKYDYASDDFNSGATEITFNSDYCDVDLYNIRIYSGARLTDSQVVHNYIADFRDVKAYDANKIVITKEGSSAPVFDYNEMLTYNSEHPNETIIPYMVIESLDTDNKLPYVKGGKKAVNIEFYNPALDYAYNMGYITAEEYLQGAPSFKYECPSKTLNVQGTSSQGYPRRNFKWKAKDKNAKWRYAGGPLEGYAIYEYNADQNKYVGADLTSDSGEIIGTYKKYFLDSDIGETTFCFKADYMDSSGSHNTGFASYISTLYNKHPLKDYFPKANLPSSLRTTVYGFPMLVFQKTGANSYEFVGRYNFNLDKSATDTCGFTYDAESYVKGDDGQFLPISKVAECWELKNNQGQRCSFTKVDFEETTDSYELAEVNSTTFEEGKYYYVSHTNTSTGVQTYELATAYDANKIYYTKQAGVLDLLGDFEYRYSAFDDEIDDAVDGTGEFAAKTQKERNEAILYRMRNFKEVVEWLASTDVSTNEKLGQLLGEYTKVSITAEDFTAGTHYVYDEEYGIWKQTTVADSFDASKTYATCIAKPVSYGEDTYQFDTKEYRLAKFRNEFSQHFDQHYSEIYFITTELLHLYDSRGKNLMLATWGPHKTSSNYIWYPIFYDIDTQLGINNSGVPTWDYDVNPTEENLFSTTNSVLWNNLWAVFSDSIINTYIDLRKNQLNIDALNGYYNSHPVLGRSDIDSWKDIENDSEGMAALKAKINSYAKIGKKPVMIYNVDEYYKFIAPSITGYVNTSGGTSTTATFYYCLQGTRELMRYLYLRNRLNFVDSKWHAGAYSIQGALGHLKMRYDANFITNNATSDRFLYTNDVSLHGTTKEEYAKDGTLIGTYTLWNWDSYGPHPLDCPVDFQNVRSFLKQYMTLQLDDSLFDSVYCDGNSAITLKTNSAIENSIKTQPALTQQLVYLGGGEYIADIGDLGTKYLDEFVATTLKRLTSLRLGSDAEGYFNSQLDSSNCQIGANALNQDGSPNKEAKTLLQELVLTGLTKLNSTIDVSGSEKLKILRALRTIITSVNLADGTQIETLHLPNTITNITLTEPVALKGIITKEAVNPDDKGLFIEGITNSNGNYDNDIAVSTYAITGGKMGYDSYRLLDILVNFKKAMIERDSKQSKSLSVNLKEINWSPYSVVEYGEPYYEDNASLYFVDNQRYSLEPYAYEESTWEFYTKNERIYLLDNSINASIITDLSIFDTFIDSYNTALDDYNSTFSKLKNYFNSATSTQPISLPELTGMVYIDNSTAIDEDKIANYYLKYFPKLKFFFKNVNQSYMSVFVTYIDGVEQIIYSERKSKSESDLSITYPPLSEYTPIRLNYDFMGWSLDKDALPTADNVYHPTYTEDFENKWKQMVYSSSNAYRKFYAIFETTKYKVYFKNYYKNGQIEDIIDPPIEVVAGEYLYDPGILPITDESSLQDNERYRLLGWVSDTKYCFPEDETEGKKHLVKLETILSENADKTFYACYVKELVTDSITDLSYFQFEMSSYKDKFDTATYDISQGYKITLKSGVSLAGKITIPGTYNGLPVIELFGINGQKNLTHIYFEKPEYMRKLRSLNSNSKLVYIDWPSGLREIGDEAFLYDYSLRHPDGLKNTKLAVIGNSAFREAFDINLGEIKEFALPGTIMSIGDYGCANINNSSYSTLPKNYRINTVSFGTLSDPCGNFKELLSRINPNAYIFTQRDLSDINQLPEDAGINTSTVIRSFIFYKPATVESPTQSEFEAFINSNRVLNIAQGTNALEYTVVEV